MENPEPSLATLAAELADLRVALDEQRRTNARQQAEINMLQAQLSERLPMVEIAAPSIPHTAQLHASATQMPQTEQVGGSLRSQKGTGQGTSRRRLLRGAAAAAVATVAVGAAEQAHAAPQATGSNLILGQTNDAGAATVLQPTSGTSPTSLLTINNPIARSAGITISTSSGVGVSVTDSGAGTGLAGTSTGGTGVVANSSSGTALSASSSTGIGVQGSSTSRNGDSSYGVSGNSQSSYGVVGYSVSSDDLAAIGTGRIYQKLQQSQYGPPTSGLYRAGESLRDVTGDLWLCVWGDGTSVGQWRKVALLAPGVFGGGAISYLGKPIRIFDSRAGFTDALFCPGKPCTSSAPTTVPVGDDVYNGVTVPHSPAGAIGNLTITNTSGYGYIEIVPSGAGFTGSSNMAYGPGQVVSNFFNVQLNGGALDIIIGGASVDAIIDLFAIIS